MSRLNPGWPHLRLCPTELTSWDQYRQIFDAIVKSNGWDDATVALQLLSHLEGDALNVTFLVPEVTRVTRIGLVGTLTDHYGLPGRLADYRRQFERTVRQNGEDPSQFAVALEVAIKASGDMGPNTISRLIRDRFIAVTQTVTCGGTSIVCRLMLSFDIFRRQMYRVWESHADTDDRRVVKPTPERARPVYVVGEPTLVLTEQVIAAVTGPSVGFANLKAMLKRLFPGTLTQAP